VTTRPEELSTLEALDLTNGEDLAELLNRGAKNIRSAHPNWHAEALAQWLYRSALCREPTSAEVNVARDIVGESAADEQVADLLWSVFMLPEFQMVR